MLSSSFDIFKHIDKTCKIISNCGIDMPLRIARARFEGLPEDLRQALVRARHANRWSQRELASRVGLPQVHISAIETGKVAPRFNTLLDLVRILGFDLLLVPRPLVPAVRSHIRDYEHPASQGTDEDERPLYATEEEEGSDEP
jgi:transcriptional regulator with XRE-family HTH domain